jgi:hypothetical protein
MYVVMTIRQARRVQEVMAYHTGDDTDVGLVQSVHDDCLATFGNVCEEAYEHGRLGMVEEKVLDDEGTLEVCTLRLVQGTLTYSLSAHSYERTLS